MLDHFLKTYSCPLFLFDPEKRRGQLFNPATGLVELEFPGEESGDDAYPLHESSALTPGFARYLHYLVNRHILFTRQTSDELVCVEDETDEYEDLFERQDSKAESDLEFSTVCFRPPLNFDGLSGLYDRLGFCFLNGALYTPMYCDVIETKLRS